MERSPVAHRVWLMLALGIVVAREAAFADDTETRRLISARTAALLAAMRPKFDATAKPKEEQVPFLLQRAGAPSTDADVIRLAPFFVIDRYVPPLAVVDPNAAAEKVERKHLGSAHGLDRAVLNRFTLAEYWGRIPLLRQITLAGGTSMTNEQRANQFERADERSRRNRDIMDATEATKGTADEKQDRELRKQFQEALADPRYR